MTNAGNTERYEPSKEERAMIQVIHHATQMMSTRSVFNTSLFLLDAPTPKEMPMFDIAVNHCAISVMSNIARQAKTEPQSGEEQLRGAAMLPHIMAIRAVTLWAAQHPQEALRIEREIQRLSDLYSAAGENFNQRAREENCTAVRQALKDRPGTPAVPNLDPGTHNSLSAIRETCARNLKQAEGNEENQEERYIYFHDSHFDQYTTFTWTGLMLEALDRNKNADPVS